MKYTYDVYVSVDGKSQRFRVLANSAVHAETRAIIAAQRKFGRKVERIQKTKLVATH